MQAASLGALSYTESLDLVSLSSVVLKVRFCCGAAGSSPEVEAVDLLLLWLQVGGGKWSVFLRLCR